MTFVATGRGRPLRFLGIVLSGWIGLRIVLLWPQSDYPADLDSPVDMVRAIRPVPVAPTRTAAMALARTPTPPRSVRESVSPLWRVAVAAHPRRAADSTRVAYAVLGLIRFDDHAPVEQPSSLFPGVPRALPAAAPASLPARWSGSAWLVARGGAGIAPGGLGGQLGGSQAGVRLAFLLDRKRRVALAARITSPLGPGLREAALGMEWQPTRLPIRLVAEQRFAVTGGRSGPVLGVVGGLGPVALPLHFRLEGYGQAGISHRADTAAYADGAVHIARPIGTIGPVRIDLGAGAWGGAQRGAARLDIGPSLGMSVPLGKQDVRISLDWRQRVAGDARPGSGAALTLGTDF